VRLRAVRRVAFFAGLAFLARFFVALRAFFAVRRLAAFFVAFLAFLAVDFFAVRRFLAAFFAVLRVDFFAADLRAVAFFRVPAAFFLVAFRFAGAFRAFLALAFFAGGTGTTFLESSRVGGSSNFDALGAQGERRPAPYSVNWPVRGL
jgi:hypothetical protein